MAPGDKLLGKLQDERKIRELEIRDWFLRLTGKEISNLDAISLSNCPKLSENERIKPVE